MEASAELLDGDEAESRQKERKTSVRQAWFQNGRKVKVEHRAIQRSDARSTSTIVILSFWLQKCATFLPIHLLYNNINNIKILKTIQTLVWNKISPYSSNKSFAVIFTECTYWRYSYPCTESSGSSRLAFTGFLDNRHMVARLSCPTHGRLYPQQIFLVLTSVGGWVDSRATLLPGELNQWRIQMTTPGIERAIFRLVSQCLNQLRHRVRSSRKYNTQSISKRTRTQYPIA